LEAVLGHWDALTALQSKLEFCWAGYNSMKYRVGDLTIDTGTQVVSRDGAPIALPKLSYDLLLVLVRAAPNLLSLDELMRLVWPGIVVSPETVSQRIKLLRDALGDNPHEPRYIAGLRGRGYQLIAAVKEPETESAASAPATVEPAAPGPKRRRSRLLRIGVFVVFVLALGWILADKFWIPKPIAQEKSAAAVSSTPAPAVPAIPEKSVAVLPFVDMSEKKDQEYFSDGLSEELIDRLTRTGDLKVIARTSSFQFKGKNDDVRKIGQRLGVAHLLEGSVRTSGKTLRVTAQLIKVSDGSHLWSQSYDRDIGDIFKVQDSIAAAVVTALHATMLAASTTVTDQPVKLDVYDALLRGRYFFTRWSKQDSERALAAYGEATRLDPNNSEAWNWLGWTYYQRAGWMPRKDAYAEARKAADRALAIEPNLASAHNLLGALASGNGDVLAATAAFARGRHALIPDKTQSWGIDAPLMFYSGHVDEAIHVWQHSAESDPLNAFVLGWLQSAFFITNRLEEAERVGRFLIETDSAYASAHCTLGEVLLARHKPEAALAVMREEQDEAARLSCVPNALWVLGRHAEAEAILSEAKTKYADTEAYNIAQSYALRNDKEQAFTWLVRACDKRADCMLLKQDPLLRNLQGDPRFTALLRKINLPE
jgi:TolB-like protein/DNA-binding winged helix-turn-helix (wHTH) protein